MAQIQSPETYADGQQVTAARLNNQTNGATLLPGAVTDQTALTANTVASGDQVILHDASASALRKATAGDLLGSGLPIATSSITGGTGVDLAITPAAGQKVDVGGAFEANSLNVVGNSTVGGNETVTGALSVTGVTTFTGNAIANGSFTSNGIANFTGTLQVNGSTAYVLYDVYEETLASWTPSSAGVQSAVVATSSFTKPSDEIWVFQIDGTWTMVRGYGAAYAFRYSTETFRTGSYLEYDSDYSSGVTGNTTRSIHHTWTVPAGTALSARTVVTDVNVGVGSDLRMFQNTPVFTDIITTGSLPASRFRIMKYKTA